MHERANVETMHKPFLTTVKGVLFAEDCMKFMNDMQASCVDCVLAHSTFNLSRDVKDYRNHRDKLNPIGLKLTDFWEDALPNRHQKFKVRPGVNELKLIVPERAIPLPAECLEEQ